jgi:hypothetical protein
MQASAADAAAYLPATQGEQLDEPSLAENVPAEQPTHVIEALVTTM